MRAWYLLVTGLAFVANSARSQTPRPETPIQAQKTFILGQRLGEDLEHRDGSISDPAVLGYVQELESRLAAVTGTTGLIVHITLSSKSYARLFPNGVLYISGDLYERLENEAELAGLLAHQLAHAKETTTPIQIPGTIPILSPVCVLASEIAPF
jgi:predicted Zn-dependent protease